MILLDTHQHLLYRERIGYAWADAIPALADSDFTVQDYQALTAGAEMRPGIFMETAADDADYQEEARMVSEIAEDGQNGIAALIASCRPEEPSTFDAWLERCAEMPVVGFRRILHEVPDAVSQSGNFRKNVRKLGAAGYTFDMVFRADQLGIGLEFARACDNTVLILDHCGAPDIQSGKLDPWRDDIAALARLPHVHCKVSGILAYCEFAKATEQAIRPYVEHVFECFGMNRLVWGSDWPVVNLTSNLPEWIRIFESLCRSLSVDEQHAIGYRNAQRIYGPGA